MPTRRLILAFITRYIRDHGFAPTIREIMAACNIASTSAVAFHLKRLAADGVIVREPGLARGYRLANERLAVMACNGRLVMPGDRVQVDVDGLVTHGAFVA